MALGLLGLTGLCLVAMPLLVAGMIGMPGDGGGASPHLRALLAVIVVAAPLLLLAAIGTALAGWRAARKPLPHLLIAGIGGLCGLLLIGMY